MAFSLAKRRHSLVLQSFLKEWFGIVRQAVGSSEDVHPKLVALKTLLAVAVLAMSVAVSCNKDAYAASNAMPINSGWQAPPGVNQLLLWPKGAPDMPAVPQAKERVEITKAPDLVAGLPYSAVHDVAAPTMSVFPPKRHNTGVAIVVFPGGGFQILAIDLEGTEICDWMTSKGITCVLVKYRVPKSANYYEKSCDCEITPKISRALQDAQRAIKLVRARANELHINPHKIGVIGMSAGGYLVAETSNILRPAYKPVDAVDELSSRPDFAIALYPGHLCRSGGKLDPGLHVTKNTPPTFILQAWDDPVDDVCNSIVYARALHRAGAPAEVHLFAKGGHAFGLRRTSHPITKWPMLVEDWLKDISILPTN